MGIHRRGLISGMGTRLQAALRRRVAHLVRAVEDVLLAGEGDDEGGKGAHDACPCESEPRTIMRERSMLQVPRWSARFGGAWRVQSMSGMPERKSAPQKQPHTTAGSPRDVEWVIPYESTLNLVWP